MLALDQIAEFDPARDEEFFGTLPPRPAVFRIEPRAEGSRPYLRRTANLRRSCRRLLGPVMAPAEVSSEQPPHTGRPPLNLRETAARVRYRLTASPFEQSLTLYGQARELFPSRYRERLRLAPPALLKINLAKEYPRCYVTRRISGDGAVYFGPFSSRRAAEEFVKEFLAMFRIRRCHIPIRRDPQFPGCIYSEMKMCLAPCYAGCTKAEYDAEISRVANFLSSRGDSLIAELEAERDRASSGEDFESAAAVHKKRDKVVSLLRKLPELPRNIDILDAVILQAAAVPGFISAFRVYRGAIADPLLLNFRELSSMPRPVELILRDYLENEEEHPTTRDFSADSLSLLARWFYSKPRSGEIIFRDISPKNGWPYRRILRACGRVLGPQDLFHSGPSSTGDVT